MRTIVFTGPESTGKTTLALALADFIATRTNKSALLVPEYTRTFYEERIRKLGTPAYQVADLMEIAEANRAHEDAARAVGPDILLLDTDIVSTQVYAEHYYGNDLPDSIRQKLKQLRAVRSTREYILCDIDWPWNADPLRDREHFRGEMKQGFVGALEGETFTTLQGTYEERLAKVCAMLGV